MSDKKKAFWFIALLSTLVIIPFLGETIFYSKGEPREAIVAYSMLESGNWILPLNYGTDIAYKPPFLYWSIAAISAIFGGVSEFSSRLPSAIAFLAMQFVFFGFVARYKDTKTAVITPFYCSLHSKCTGRRWLAGWICYRFPSSSSHFAYYFAGTKKAAREYLGRLSC